MIESSKVPPKNIWGLWRNSKLDRARRLSGRRSRVSGEGGGPSLACRQEHVQGITENYSNKNIDVAESAPVNRIESNDDSDGPLLQLPRVQNLRDVELQVHLEDQRRVEDLEKKERQLRRLRKEIMPHAAASLRELPPLPPTFRQRHHHVQRQVQRPLSLLSSSHSLPSAGTKRNAFREVEDVDGTEDTELGIYNDDYHADVTTKSLSVGDPSYLDDETFVPSQLDGMTGRDDDGNESIVSELDDVPNDENDEDNCTTVTFLHRRLTHSVEERDGIIIVEEKEVEDVVVLHQEERDGIIIVEEKENISTFSPGPNNRFQSTKRVKHGSNFSREEEDQWMVEMMEGQMHEPNPRQLALEENRLIPLSETEADRCRTETISNPRSKLTYQEEDQWLIEMLELEAEEQALRATIEDQLKIKELEQQEEEEWAAAAAIAEAAAAVANCTSLTLADTAPMAGTYSGDNCSITTCTSLRARE